MGAKELKKAREAATNEEFSSMFHLLPALFHYSEIESYAGESPYIRDAWLDGIQVMISREQEGSSKGLYLAAKGGHNDESHNHNDIGNFIIYCNGAPMIIDPGVLTYTSKSFFGERYTIWAMQSAYHNLPIVNGVQQKNGREFKAKDVSYSKENKLSSLSMDISGAYPDSAGIKSWVRSMSLIRDSHPYIEIKDNFQFQHGTDDITLILMTPHLPQIKETGSIVLQDQDNNKIIIHNDREMFAASVEEIALDDEVMIGVWGSQLYRIKLKAGKAALQGEFIMKINKL